MSVIASSNHVSHPVLTDKVTWTLTHQEVCPLPLDLSGVLFLLQLREEGRGDFQARSERCGRAYPAGLPHGISVLKASTTM